MIRVLWLRLIRFRLIGDGNVFYVSPAHSEILKLQMEYLLGWKEQWTLDLELIINDQLTLINKLNSDLLVIS